MYGSNPDPDESFGEYAFRKACTGAGAVAGAVIGSPAGPAGFVGGGAIGGAGGDHVARKVIEACRASKESSGDK